MNPNLSFIRIKELLTMVEPSRALRFLRW